MELPVELFEFDYFPNEKISVSVGHFGVGYVDHVMIDVEIQLKHK